MRKKSKAVRTFNRWRQERRVTIAMVSEAIGDPGGQLFKWASGERPLPLSLLARVARHTGIPLDQLAEKSQLAVVRDLAELTDFGGAAA